MKNYSKTLYLLGESSLSRDSLFISELTTEVGELLLESNEIISQKISNINTTDLEQFEKQMVEIRFIRSQLLEILKVK